MLLQHQHKSCYGLQKPYASQGTRQMHCRQIPPPTMQTCSSCRPNVTSCDTAISIYFRNASPKQLNKSRTRSPPPPKGCLRPPTKLRRCPSHVLGSAPNRNDVEIAPGNQFPPKAPPPRASVMAHPARHGHTISAKYQKNLKNRTESRNMMKCRHRGDVIKGPIAPFFHHGFPVKLTKKAGRLPIIHGHSPTVCVHSLSNVYNGKTERDRSRRLRARSYRCRLLPSWKRRTQSAT